MHLCKSVYGQSYAVNAILLLWRSQNLIQTGVGRLGSP